MITRLQDYFKSLPDKQTFSTVGNQKKSKALFSGRSFVQELTSQQKTQLLDKLRWMGSLVEKMKTQRQSKTQLLDKADGKPWQPGFVSN